MEPGKKPEGLEAKSKDWVADFDFEPDEKHKTVAVTEQGVEKAEKFLGIDNMYLAEHGNLVNHLHQALKAESLYKRDVDYAVIDGEVKIIDEFTGRILEGRRWSEGLHQAVEAKEGVAIQEENQTVATITYQNYFRRYDKLAGMTGTALTEATEFMKIYELQVVEIPTNRPMLREDKNDQIYKTKDGKWAAVVREIEARTAKGQPVLVGTISVEVSELLAAQPGQEGHQAHGPERQARARRARGRDRSPRPAGPGAVTIATNMAGRGVDIKLGGNAEHLTELALRESKHEPGTEEYDKAWDEAYPELRGSRSSATGRSSWRPAACTSSAPSATSRAGSTTSCAAAPAARATPASRASSSRPRTTWCACSPATGSTGSSTASARPATTGEEEPIEAKMLSKQIEGAQKKVEEQNFLIRKRVLEYDDVMNQQREIIYEYRDKILEGEDMSATAREQLAEVVERMAEEYMPGDFPENWDLPELYTQLEQMYPVGLDLEEMDPNNADRAGTDRRAARGHRGGLRRPRGGARAPSSCARSSASCCSRSSTSAGASTCTTWTTCARASTCAASPRSTRSWPTRTRASPCSPSS